MEVFGSARAGVLPKQQVVDRQLAISVALTLRQQLLHSKHQGQSAFTQYTGFDVTVHSEQNANQMQMKDALTG